MPQDLVDIASAAKRLQGSTALARKPGAFPVCLASARAVWLFCILLLAAVVMPATASVTSQQLFLTQDIEALLNKRLERVVPYVNWTYGWAASYTNSYIVAAKIVASIVRTPGKWLDVATDTIRDQQLRSLRERVTRPEADATEVSKLIDRHVRSRVFSDRAILLNALCPEGMDSSCPSPERNNIDAAAKSILQNRATPEAVAKEDKALTDLLNIHSGVDIGVAHTFRPLLSRLLIFILRLTELSSIIVLITAGLRRIYLPNTPVIRILVTFGVAWGLDYGVLWLERATNESAFERQIIGEIQEQNRAVAAYVTAQIETAEADFRRRAGTDPSELQKWQ